MTRYYVVPAREPGERAASASQYAARCSSAGWPGGTGHECRGDSYR